MAINVVGVGVLEFLTAAVVAGGQQQQTVLRRDFEMGQGGKV